MALGCFGAAASLAFEGCSRNSPGIGNAGGHWAGGIGAVLGHSEREGRLFVRRVPADGPAFREGLRVGDEVVAIDGRTIEGRDYDEVARGLRGEVGTVVVLRVRRTVDGGPVDRDVRIERAPYRRGSSTRDAGE